MHTSTGTPPKKKKEEVEWRTVNRAKNDRSIKAKNVKTTRTGRGIKSKIGCWSFCIYEWNRDATFRGLFRSEWKAGTLLPSTRCCDNVLSASGQRYRHRTLPGLEENSYKLHFAPQINEFRGKRNTDRLWLDHVLAPGFFLFFLNRRNRRIFNPIRRVFFIDFCDLNVCGRKIMDWRNWLKC